MSFNFDTKQELCVTETKKDCCRQAELYGMLLFCDKINSDEIRLVSEHVLVINRLCQLAYSLYKINFLLDESRSAYVASLKGESLKQLLTNLHISLDSLQLRLLPELLENPCCYNSFLKGAFLAAGSISDPSSGYHLELVTRYYQLSKDVKQWLNALDIHIKSVVRKSNYVLYLKDSASIEQFLYFIGAKQAAFEIANVKIYKEIQNRNNRISNCTEYNVDKSINAAVAQIKAIEIIEKEMGLDALADDLRVAAVLRKNNPSATLSELIKVSNGCFSKSGLSRKLSKLVDLSKRIKQ